MRFFVLFIIVAVSISACHHANAPQEVLNTVSIDADPVDLLSAFKATYGGAPPTELAVPDSVGLSATQLATTPSSSTKLYFTPTQLLRLPSGIFVLIAKGVDPMGCHACGGVLSVNYLKKTATTFEILSRPYPFGPRGSFGEAPSYTIRADLYDGPALQVVASDGAQGCGGDEAGIYELGPVSLIERAADIPLSKSFDGSSGGKQFDISGKIIPETTAEAGEVSYNGTEGSPSQVRTFKVVYTGSINEVVHYSSSGQARKILTFPTC